MATEDSRVRLVCRRSHHISHTGYNESHSKGAYFLPVPPASPATTLSCSPATRGITTSTSLSPPCIKRVGATSRCPSSSKPSATRWRGLVINQGKGGLILDMEICKRARGATAKSLSTVPLRSPCRTARVADIWKANSSLAIFACGVVPVCKPAEFVRFGVWCIRDVLELELFRDVRWRGTPSSVWIIVNWW